MNHFGLSVMELDGEAPAGPVVSAAELDRYISAAARIGAARQRAARKLWRTRCALADARRGSRAQTKAYASELLAAARREAACLSDEARLSAVGETVTWLVAESALERSVAARLEQRFRDLLGSALKAYAAAEPSENLIANQVARHLEELAEHGKLTLRVAAERVEPIAARIDQLTQQKMNLEVVAEATLSDAQAVLDSPYVQIRVDLERHLDEILGRLAGPAGEPEADHGRY
ncbi:hypothetical protein B0G84_9133 [Paraburkholderia sp. BL8N3]|nr:hypothetical protein B0G84_9133 [Paraburkholderia sp. BL8N3]